MKEVESLIGSKVSGKMLSAPASGSQIPYICIKAMKRAMNILVVWGLAGVVAFGTVSCASGSSAHSKKTRAFKRTRSNSDKMPCPIKDC